MGMKDWFHRRPSDDEMREELEAHVAMRAEHDSVDATAARRRLGNTLRTREDMRRVWVPQWIDTLTQDGRFAWRGLRRNPSFTLVAVVTLALAIGANTAVYSVVHHVLLRPLPYPESDRLVHIDTVEIESGLRSTGIPDYLDWKAAATTMEAMEGYRPSYRVDEDNPERRLRLLETTPGMPALLGVRPVLGRLFQESDLHADAPPIVVLSYERWMTRFGGDPTIVGRSIRLGEDSRASFSRPEAADGAAESPLYTVIGVAAPVDPSLPGQVDAWLLWNVGADYTREARFLRQEGITVLGRLKPGVTLAHARADLEAIGAVLQERYPESNDLWMPAVKSAHDDAVSSARPTLVALLGATGLVLLIAISNIANLLLARGTARMTELSVRTALGATRRRVARLLLTESLALAMIGGLAGIALGWAGIRVLLSLEPAWIPRVHEVALDARVLAVCLAATAGAGLLFGLAPAVMAGRTRAAQRTQTGAGSDASPQLLRSGLVVAQIALSLILLTGSGLMIRSFLALRSVPIGVDYQHIISLTLGGSSVVWGPPIEAGRAGQLERYREVVDLVRGIAGVRAVTLTSQPPLSGASSYVRAEIVGESAGASPLSVAPLVAVTADFFEFFDRRAVAGRLFDSRDSSNADEVVVVDATLASALWPQTSAVGQRVRVSGIESEVIGVVDPIRYGPLAALDMEPKLFHLLDRSDGFGVTMLVRHDGNPEPIMDAIRARTTALSPPLRPTQLQPLSVLYDGYLREPRFYLLLLGLLGSIALVVAAVGVYGVVSYSVARRTGEIGIRMALGAQRRQIAALFCGRTAGVVSVGLAAGLLGAAWLSRYIENLLFQIAPTDPLALGSMAVLLALAALAATLIPLRRALSVDPASTLRAE